MRKITDLKVLSYNLLKKETDGYCAPITLENMGKRSKLSDEWAIKWALSVFNKAEKVFDHEPQPFLCDENRLNQFRFKTPQEALKCFDEEYETRRIVLGKIIKDHFSSAQFKKLHPEELLKLVIQHVVAEYEYEDFNGLIIRSLIFKK